MTNGADTAQTAPAHAGSNEAGAGTHGLYESRLSHFRELAQKDLPEALRRYGFAFFYSLSPDEQSLARERLGMKCRGGADYYNLALAYAGKEEWDKAISLWTQSLKADPTLTDALRNIALAYERQGNRAQAQAYYKRYMDAVGNPAQIARVKQHLAELGG